MTHPLSPVPSAERQRLVGLMNPTTVVAFCAQVRTGGRVPPARGNQGQWTALARVWHPPSRTCADPRLGLSRAQTVDLILRRVCALPTCANAGGQHLPLLCSEPRCPEWARSGGKHSSLLGEFVRAARPQHRLWRPDSKHDAAEWWAFPEHDAVALLEGVVLPAKLSGYTLTALELHVRIIPDAPAH